MSWNWIKIKSIKDLPDFNRAVVLYQKKEDGKEYAMIGLLKSIDAKGYHWGQTALTASIFDMAGFFNTTPKDDFKPTHWCDVEKPVEEPEAGPIKFEQLQRGMYVKVVFLDDENDDIKTEETGTVEVVNWNKKNFILRHDKRNSSVRIMNEWEELHKL